MYYVVLACKKMFAPIMPEAAKTGSMPALATTGMSIPR